MTDKKDLTCEQVNEIMVECFPGVGFAISDAYDGETTFDKMIMAEGHEKPSLKEFQKRARAAGKLK